ncbi:hypothetical protein TD95_004353 [Thielaviopsis punctulata]|uniref:Mediator of RNA polymerase II transcription subunit 1 n=1 Tax=Thielaviopsis punctulata TaxID=72032 RepID=A0A0F4Z8C9_9PEZI|nr:hypothetical protein TD95_004353 [Thielaviopsis punctulata]
MTTPTPGKNGISSQGRTPQIAAATPPVSTPFSHIHAGASFSPRAARSSPQNIKKSPANVNGLAPPSQSGVFSFDSPSAAAALGNLGMGELGLDHVGVGALGVNNVNNEDEKAKRLDAVIDLLSTKRGYVSEAGIERLVHRIGLDCIWEGAANKSRTLIIAGQALNVDVVFQNNLVQSVTLQFPETAGIEKEHTDRAAAIILQDLQLGKYQSPLTKTLDRFAVNLERLAILDKLSVIPGLDCQEALSGMAFSLEKVFAFDVAKARLDNTGVELTQEAVENMVMCTKHGYPIMHTRDSVGLSLLYWKEKRLVPVAAKLQKFVEEYEIVWSILVTCAPAPIGTSPFGLMRVSRDWISPNVIKADSLPEETLNSVTGVVLDWLHPENTLLPASKEGNMGLSQPKYPEVIFKAVLDPPVVLTHSAYMQVLEITGQAMPVQQVSVTFDGLIFPVPKDSNYVASEPRKIKSVRKIVRFENSGRSSVVCTYDTSLFIYKPVYGQVLDEVPFSHPRQLIDILPMLRQYALLSTLLRNTYPLEVGRQSILKEDNEARCSQTFKAFQKKQDLVDKINAPAPPEERDGLDNRVVRESNGNYTIFNRSESGEDVPGASDKEDAEKKPKIDGGIDVILSIHPVPRLQVTFRIEEPDSEQPTTTDIKKEVEVDPYSIDSMDIGDSKKPEPSDIGDDVKVKEPRMGAVTVEIRLNGDLQVVSQNAFPAGSSRDPQILGRTLMIMEDICAWCEWMRTRLDWSHIP